MTNRNIKVVAVISGVITIAVVAGAIVFIIYAFHSKKEDKISSLDTHCSNVLIVMRYPREPEPPLFRTIRTRPYTLEELRAYMDDRLIIVTEPGGDVLASEAMVRYEAELEAYENEVARVDQQKEDVTAKYDRQISEEKRKQSVVTSIALSVGFVLVIGVLLFEVFFLAFSKGDRENESSGSTA